MEDFFQSAKLNLEIDKNEVRRLFELFDCDATNNNKDKLALVVHLIMIKSHFKSSHNSLAITQSKDDSYYNKMSYTVFEKENRQDPCKSIKISLAASIVISLLKSTSSRVEIQLKYKHFLSQFLRVDLDDELFESSRRLQQFQTQFQNVILIPAKLNIKASLLHGGGGSESIAQVVDNPNNLDSFCIDLTDLPVEILVYRLAARYLNARGVCAMSMLNRQSYLLFNGNPTSTESIWRTLIQRDFKECDLSEFSGDYRKKYAEQVKKSKQYLWYPTYRPQPVTPYY